MSRKAAEKQERGQPYPVAGPPSWELMGSRGALRRLTSYVLGIPSLSLALPQELLIKLSCTPSLPKPASEVLAVSPDSQDITALIPAAPGSAVHVLTRSASWMLTTLKEVWTHHTCVRQTQSLLLHSANLYLPADLFFDRSLSQNTFQRMSGGEPSGKVKFRPFPSLRSSHRQLDGACPAQPSTRHTAALLADCFVCFYSLKGQSLHRNIK